MAYIGQRPVIGRYIKLDQISSGFNGSNTGFSMTAGSQAVFPGTARNLLLSLGGVIQEPDTDFTISGSTLTFTTPPVANTTFFGVIYGDMQATGTPSDGTVLPASIASSGHFKIPQLTVNEDGADVDFRVEGDTEANLLFVDAGEDKVGIGTGTPSGARLHIVGSGNTGLKVQVGSSSADQIYLGNTGGASSVGTLTNVGFNLIQNGGVALAVDTNKNVGIGEPSPTYPTEIKVSDTTAYSQSTTNSTQHQLRINNAGLGGVAGILLTAEPSSGSAGHAGIRVISPSSGKADMTFSVRDSGTYDEKLRILNDGNVGIGTTNPVVKLVVSNGGAEGLEVSHSSGTVEVNAYNRSGSARSPIDIIGQTFKVLTGNPSLNEGLFQASDGNVGIGTTSPESNLHIHVSSASTGPFLRFTNPNGGDGTYLGRISCGDTAGTFFTGVNFFKHDTNDGEIRFRMKVAGTNADVLTLVDGRAGIGTTSPKGKLDIDASGLDAAGDVDDPNDYAIVIRNSPTTDQGNGIAFTNDSGAHVGGAIIHIDKGSNNLGDLAFYTAASSSTPQERLRIKSSGHVALTSGNLEFASGAGIDFSAVSDGSRSIDTDGNKFDDYEEGSFTPTLTCQNSLLTASYINQDGKYTKIGRMVYFQIYIRLSAKSGGSGQLRVSNLPFSSSSATGAAYGGAYAAYTFNWDNDALDRMMIGSGSNEIQCFIGTSNGTNVNAGAGNLNSDTQMRILGSYHV